MAIDSIGSYSSQSQIPLRSDRKVVEVDKSVSENAETTQAALNMKQGNQQIDSAKQQEDASKEPSKEVSENHLKSALSVANSKIRMTNTRCEFEYHEKTKRVSIKVIDKQTDKVVREIPPEETLEMVEKIWELAGLFVDEKR